MIETLLRRLLEHKRRKTVVIILTVLTGLLIVLPAADEYNAAKERMTVANAKLVTARSEVEGLAVFEELFQTKDGELKELRRRGVSEADAQELRSQLVEMISISECTMRQVRLGNVVQRDWMSKDDPVRGTRMRDRGEPTPYTLETRQISLSLAGTMTDLQIFMSQIHSIDRFIHTKSVSLKRADGDENLANLDTDLLLFNLVKKPAE